MQRVAAETVLATFAVGAFAVMMITVFASGPTAMWSLILVGFFHSIMFPTIFTLAIKGLGPLTEEGSGLLIMAIAGGALVIVQGWLADRYGLQLSFLLTAACELYILFYALWGAKPTNALPSQQPEPIVAAEESVAH
jgi:FHS family L-fucose permease-like MFS transporter